MNNNIIAVESAVDMLNCRISDNQYLQLGKNISVMYRIRK
jgi:hypothetical protein